MRSEKAKTPERKEAQRTEGMPPPPAPPLSPGTCADSGHWQHMPEPTLYVYFVKPGQLLTELAGISSTWTIVLSGNWMLSTCTGWETKILSGKLLKNRAQYPAISQDKEPSPQPAGQGQ